MAKKGRDGTSGKDGKKMLAGHPPHDADGKDKPRIDPRVQREIGRHLRAQYDDIVNEPVPDRFLELLEQLEQSVEKD